MILLKDAIFSSSECGHVLQSWRMSSLDPESFAELLMLSAKWAYNSPGRQAITWEYRTRKALARRAVA